METYDIPVTIGNRTQTLQLTLPIIGGLLFNPQFTGEEGNVPIVVDIGVNDDVLDGASDTYTQETFYPDDLESIPRWDDQTWFTYLETIYEQYHGRRGYDIEVFIGNLEDYRYHVLIVRLFDEEYELEVIGFNDLGVLQGILTALQWAGVNYNDYIWYVVDDGVRMNISNISVIGIGTI